MNDPRQTFANLLAAKRLLLAGFPDYAEAILVSLEPERGRNAISSLRAGNPESARQWLAEVLAEAILQGGENLTERPPTVS